jgi:prepilin-type N-terminal cleavage/methylation domain-containing protein
MLPISRTTKKGFTLVETLVAISILMISIVGPFYSIYKAVQATYIARDQLIATELAQEGIEYVRNTRDQAFLTNLAAPGSVPWTYGLDPCIGGIGCTVDAGVDPILGATACSGKCDFLYLSGTGFYNQKKVGTATRFTRTVRVNVISSNEMVVTVTVSWYNLQIPYTVTLSEHLYNWL